jgi:hypothetical protein
MVLCLQTYFHWGLLLHDAVGFSIFLVGAGILCALRELTPSVWNCILFHAAYNAISLREWTVYATIIVVSALSLAPLLRLGSLRHKNL